MASPLAGNLTGPIVRAQARLRYSTVTPMKARRVVDLVRGLPADEALAILRFAPQSASEPVYKVLESAVANAQYAAGQRNERLDVEDLVVSQAFVDEGPTLKRFRPRAQGRAYRIRKRTSHITIHVESWSADTETQANKRAVPKRVKTLARASAPVAAPAKETPAAKTAKAASKTAEEPAKKTTEKTAAKAVDKPADKPAKKAAEKPVEKPAEKPAAKAAEKPATKKTADAAQADKPAKKAAEVVATDTEKPAAKKTVAKRAAPAKSTKSDDDAQKPSQAAADEDGGTR